MIAGCTGALRGGVLYLTLDTRGSSVNVFTPAVALELERELEAGLAAGARAVVLQSAKPGSFVNGVGLLLAASSPAQGAAATLRSLLSTLRARHWPKRPPERHASSGAPAIDALPGPERRLARECLRLARLPFARDYRLEDGLREELASFWSSLGTKESEQAMSFFFVRQAAKAHGIGSAAYQRPPRLAIAVESRTPALRKLARLLVQRRLPGIEVKARGSIAFSTRKVPGALTCTLGGPRTEADCAAFLPLAGGAAIELVPGAPERPWRGGAALL